MTKNLSPQARFDAVSYFLDQELEAKDPRKFAQLVPGIVGRRILSNVQGLTRSQPVYAYEMLLLKARTKKGAPKAKDAQTVEVLREKVTHTIEEYPASMEWHLDEVEAARENGRNLPDDKRLAAVTKLEEAIDKSLAEGDGSTTGLLNNSNISATTAAAKTGGGTTWTGAGVTADEMAKDVAKAISDTASGLKQSRIPGSDMPNFGQWCLVLPDSWYIKAATTYRTNTDHTALDMILRMPMIKSVVPWWRAETADSGANRAALIPALDNGAINPMAAGSIVPLDFDQAAPTLVGFNVVTACRAKAGGVAIPYPIACRYIDLT